MTGEEQSGPFGSCGSLRRATDGRRPDLAGHQNNARLARSSSEGCMRRRSSSVTKLGTGLGPSRQSQNPRGSFVWKDERRQSSSGFTVPATAMHAPKGREAASRCATPVKTRRRDSDISCPAEVSGLNLSGVGPQGMQAQDHEIHQEVSSLVEELEAARLVALKAGKELPKPIEVAASALEPLLRLRDVTGAFACDLTAMPWLPQLLTVFRNVLRTAVDAGHQSEELLTNADSGAGGASGNARGAAAAQAAAQAAAAAAAAMAALGSQQMQPHGTAECQKLREQLRHQDAELKQYKQREAQLQKDLEELRRERDRLAKEGGKDALARRVADLEHENEAWNSEWNSVEARVNGLVGMVGSALASS